MGLFWSDAKPGVSKTEFKEKVLVHLVAQRWTSENIERVKLVFSGGLEEEGLQKGIDRKEIEAGINLLKKSGHISSEKLDDLKQYMMSLAR